MSKTINWSSYNKSLIGRGAITFWISNEVIQTWYDSKDPTDVKRGAPQLYSDEAIEMLSVLRFRFKLTLRETQGFAQSLMQLMGLEYLAIPNYTTLSRRLAKLNISIIRTLRNKDAIHVVVDSTGLKVFGEGEWKVRQHGISKRRSWIKLHLGVDESNNQIISAVVTENNFKDNQVFDDLLNNITEPLYQVTGDGAYDAENCYQKSVELGITPIFPPRKDAAIRCKHHPRNEHIKRIKKIGKKAWKVETNYHRRSIAETTMFRLKQITGNHIVSRNFEHQANELFIRCNILNQMLLSSAR